MSSGPTNRAWRNHREAGIYALSSGGSSSGTETEDSPTTTTSSNSITPYIHNDAGGKCACGCNGDCGRYETMPRSVGRRATHPQPNPTQQQRRPIYPNTIFETPTTPTSVMMERVHRFGNQHIEGYEPFLLRMGQPAQMPLLEYTPDQAHPIIKGNGHAIHAVISKEMYKHPSIRRTRIGQWKLVVYVAFNTERFCFYHMGEYVIMGCRGTSDLADVVQDWKLVYEMGGCRFDRTDEAMNMLGAFSTYFRPKRIQFTGHSLGGAVARCLSARTGHQAIVFNPAAPPTTQTTQPFGNVAYHIVMDVVSAWISSGTVYRLDAGIRIKEPSRVSWLVQNLLSFIYPYASLAFVGNELYQTIPAHAMSQFFLTGATLVDAHYENELWQNWWNSHNAIQKQMIRVFFFNATLGASGSLLPTWQLPKILA